MFTFVARDKKTGKAAAINFLDPQSPAEVRQFQQRADMASKRKTGNIVHIAEDEIVSLVEKGNSLEDMPALAHPRY
jgi:hypothetical protein